MFDEIDCILCGKTIVKVQSSLDSEVELVLFSDAICSDCYDKKGVTK